MSVADRGRAFFEWVSGREETELAVSSHSAFQRCLFSYGQVGGVRAAPDQSLHGVGLGGGGGGGANAGEGAGAGLDLGFGGGGGGNWVGMEDADAPVVCYGEDEIFEVSMREDWDNCEMRTFLVAY